MSRDADVIVVGAGPAGSATAWHLARAGVPTLLLDKSDFPRDKVCGDCLSPRAQHALARLGLLDAVAAEAHAAPRIRFTSPAGAAAETPISGAGTLPNHTLVLPRLRLGHLLQRHALAAGARFRVAHVRELLTRPGPGNGCRPLVTGVRLEAEPLHARVVVIATGAAIGLIKRTTLAPAGTVHTTAARCYAHGLPAMGPDLRIHFDQLPLPGYAWLFPTGPRSANLGLWYCGDGRHRAAALLPRLLHAHPGLSSAAGDGVRIDRVAGYPIRTDFLTAPKIAPGLLAVGEAAGLVNPFTGEGIDYALESAELAADVILRALSEQAAGALPERALQPYPRALSRRFRQLFLLMTLAQRHAFNPWVFERLFGRGRQGQPYLERLIQVCFGAAAPLSLLAPAEIGALLLSRPSLASR